MRNRSFIAVGQTDWIKIQARSQAILLFKSHDDGLRLHPETAHDRVRESAFM
jgi:hypothetical protein